jgi:hypothetical protein
MKWLIENWSLLVVIFACVCVGFVYVKKFLDKPTDEQMAKIKEWLLYAVMEAEAQFGRGTGKLKLHYVYDMFITRFPGFIDIISFEMFSKLVDEALDEMRNLLKFNLDIKACIVLDEDMEDE